LVDQLIEHHLPDLEKRNYASIARKLELPLEKILQTTRIVLELEPRPGRSFYSNDTHYITPDIYVYKVANEFVILLNEDGMPKLRISPYYKSILAEQRNSNEATKEYVQEKLRSALWLIRSIHNRQKTIYKVTEALVKRQQDFFEKGIQHLKPMILKDVATDIGMHESTISRVTTNKYVHTPAGIFELKYFFNSSIPTADGGNELASEAVKQKIRQMIQKENPKHPLSDQKIVTLLRLENIEIARRTVAKYRETLGILSSSRRKKVL
jgi:RNA polymerase sigma-54 factor